MQYKKQRKTNWWVIFLFIPLLVGCNPVTTELFLKLEVYLGDALRTTVVGKTIEIVLDYFISKFILHPPYLPDHVIVDKDYPSLSDHVIVDADNPLKGTYAGDLIFKGETANCKYTYSLKNPRIFRTSIDANWHPTSEAQERIKKSFDETC